VTRPWRVVDVASLPWPHDPFRRHWVERFRDAAAEATTDAQRQEIVRDIALGLTPVEVSACSYHDADWRTAAATAIAVVESGEACWKALDDAARETNLDDETTEAFLSFFIEPIFVNGTSLGSGQHRVCAMKLANVPRCPIEM